MFLAFDLILLPPETLLLDSPCSDEGLLLEGTFRGLKLIYSRSAQQLMSLCVSEAELTALGHL